MRLLSKQARKNANPRPGGKVPLRKSCNSVCDGRSCSILGGGKNGGMCLPHIREDCYSWIAPSYPPDTARSGGITRAGGGIGLRGSLRSYLVRVRIPPRLPSFWGSAGIGLRDGLKNHCPMWREGSNPSCPTIPG